MKKYEKSSRGRSQEVPKILIASCGRYICRNFMYANAIIMSEYYVVHQWFFINIETNDFE